MSICYRSIYFIFLFILAFPIKSNANEINLQNFLGPLPGIKYIYNGSDGSRLELVGISKDENGILEVEEKYVFPENIFKDKVPKNNSIRYKLFIDQKAIVKETIKGREILLQIPSNKKDSGWKIKGKYGRKTDKKNIQWKDVETTCQIIESGISNNFEKGKYTITTECITSNSDSSTKRVETYAEDIGLIERILFAITKDDSLKEIHRLSLKKIINIKCVK